MSHQPKMKQPDNDLSVYIPMDRRQALQRGEKLLEWSTGAALFADISGFTALTEALAHSLGPAEGAEVLATQLNDIYEALITQVHRYGGSVIGFAGDAITCWFAHGSEVDLARRATTCALAMQQAMQAFKAVAIPGGQPIAMAMKVTVASGFVRRFLVGDPNLQQLDVLAGETVARTATAEHLAYTGEILVDRPTATLLADTIQIRQWRDDPETLEDFAVVQSLSPLAAPTPWPPLPAEAFDQKTLRPWLLAKVAAQFQEGSGEFLAELRPVVALFLGFSQLDYDRDEAAGRKLNNYIRWVQQVINRFEGTLLQLIIGDKGNYLYAAFEREGDVRQAVSAALELSRAPNELAFINSAQIGLSQGIMWAGDYGGRARRTYGIIGDAVNLAARLMQNASAGKVLASQEIQQATQSNFPWELLSPIRVKGKHQPVTVAKLEGHAQARPDDVFYVGELIGYEAELSRLTQFLQPLWARQRFAGVMAIHGEAGIGKSRLVYELRQLTALPSPANAARVALGPGKGISWFICPAEAILRRSLHPFRQFLGSYFGQQRTAGRPENEQRFDETLEALLDQVETSKLLASAEVRDLISTLTYSRSFLGALVDLHWDNSLYERSDPNLRFEQMVMAFKHLILAESLCQPLVLHIEDAHWLDDDSLRLIQALVQDVQAYPFALLLTGRDREDGYRFNPNLSAAYQQTIHLKGLSLANIRTQTKQVLKDEISDGLAAFLMEKTDGNPYFVEQLALELKNQRLIHFEQEAWQITDNDLSQLPLGINKLLLSRLDQLGVPIKIVVKAAAVLGQAFEIRTLAVMLNEDEQVRAKVQQAEERDVWLALSELHYIFRHALLRDAAYKIQIGRHRSELHALAAAAIEQLYRANLSAHYAELAYHHRLAQNSPQERIYTRLAGEQAARFAVADAIDYFTRALLLTPEHDLAEQVDLLLAREAVLNLQGDRPAQARDLDTLASLAAQLNDTARLAECALRRSSFAYVTGEYAAAGAAAQQAVQWAQEAGEAASEATGYLYWGRALQRQGDYTAAQHQFEQALTLAQTIKAANLEADSLRNLGVVARRQGDFATAQRCYEQALTLQQQTGDQRGQSRTLSNLGLVRSNQGDYTAARRYQEQARQLKREIGDRRGESNVMGNLGIIALDQGNYAAALAYFQETVLRHRQGNDRRSESTILLHLGRLYDQLGAYATAQSYCQQALAIRHNLGDRQGESMMLGYLSLVAYHQGNHQAAQEYGSQALHIAREVATQPDQAQALTVLGHARLELGSPLEAAAAYQEALTLRQALGQPHLAAEILAALARVALAQGNLPQAQEYVGDILTYLDTGATSTPGEGHPLDGTDEPLRVYLTCYQTLQAQHDARAQTILESGYALLQIRAANINDASLQHSFREQVVVHQALAAARQAQP